MGVDAKHVATQPVSGVQPFGSLVLGVVVPIAYCTLLLRTKIAALVELVTEQGLATLRAQLEAAHLSLSIVFVAILAFLFVTRKKVIGPRTSLSGAIVALAGSLFPFFLALGAPSQLSDAMLLASLLILLIGEVLVVWSLASLGRCFGVFPVARGLVTHGPYAWVRHPLYTAEAIVTFGFLLTRITPVTIAIFVGGMALQAWRTINEERALEHVFPEYAEYRQQTGRFLPRWTGRYRANTAQHSA